MNNGMTYEEARKRAGELKGFYQHLIVYIFVNAFLFLANFMTSPGSWWFYWPLFGWGIGLAAHGASVLLGGGVWGKSWEERKIRQLMGDRGREGGPPEV